MYKLITTILIATLISIGCDQSLKYNGLSSDMIEATKDTILSDKIIYHFVRVDNKGDILPWHSANLGESYDLVLKLVWSFWKNMEYCSNGTKYYMNHQVWSERHDRRGLGGDQLQMALSSWDLLYNYTGDESILENMKYMADYYLAHSLSSPDCEWPDLPYPYNMDIHSGEYDGDMILGKGYLQPDKAGSFGYELIHLYKKTNDEKYLNAALKIANVLSSKVQPGDNDNSPWPFKVNAKTGETGILVDDARWHEGMDKDLKASDARSKKSGYTTFWTGSLALFDELINLQKGNTDNYRKAFDITIDWLKNFPAKTNKWGPFFEDVPRWSDTQINGITYAMYVMENQKLDSNWRKSVNNIFKWVHNELDNDRYKKYGVITINEQTAYRVPGNSHSSRQASAELKYWEETGDTTYVRNAIHMLNWATYMVDNEGKNFYPTNAIWMTDGYGDYVRHYLRAMAAAPQLAPDNADHLLRTSSVVKKISYQPSKIIYTTFDNSTEEIFRLTSRPKKIFVNKIKLQEVSDEASEGWFWQALPKGGMLKIKQAKGNQIEIRK
jgi:hypothetical protein